MWERHLEKLDVVSFTKESFTGLRFLLDRIGVAFIASSLSTFIHAAHKHVNVE